MPFNIEVQEQFELLIVNTKPFDQIDANTKKHRSGNSPTVFICNTMGKFNSKI